MSSLERPILVVGSGLEGQLALDRLAKLPTVGEIHHLSSGSEGGTLPILSRTKNSPTVKSLFLRDVWGKKLLKFTLPGYQVWQPSELSHDKITPLATGLEFHRVAQSENANLVTFQDGTETLYDLVVFADGSDSKAKSLWRSPTTKQKDPDAVGRWSFEAENYDKIKEWEYRWAIAKSMEFLPLPSGKLSVNLRFKSQYGAELSAAELQSLFSEFGSTVEGLFEGLADDAISFSREARLKSGVFSPAKGCVALGRAAWPNCSSLPFDWLERFVIGQLNILSEQLKVGEANIGSFEAQCKELQELVAEADAFLRKQLHNDNAVLRPLRNLLLNLLPASFVVGRVKQKLWLD